MNQDILQIPNPGEIGCVIHVRADIYVWLSLTPREIRPRPARTLACAERLPLHRLVEALGPAGPSTSHSEI